VRPLRGRPQVKHGFVARHSTSWPTRAMCRVPGVSCSGFEDWLGRPLSRREQHNAQLTQAIRHRHQASDGTFGAPRVVRDVAAAGLACSENRVARLIKAAGIKARHKRRRTPWQLASVVQAIVPNLLDRQFAATGLNHKCVADFTYVWTGEAKLWLDPDHVQLRRPNWRSVWP
jgi:putative transposase